MNGDLQLNITQILAFGVFLSLLPVLVISVTSFTKISIVLFLIRNALGLQQVPSNLVLQTISLTLTMFITAPVIDQIYTAASDPSNRFQTSSDLLDVAQKVKKPIIEYLEKFTSEESRIFFAETTSRLWPEQQRARLGKSDLVILIPSFLVAELKRAFEVGFLLYLPFLVVDLVVTTILIAMGLSQISPQIITVPFKVFLFIAIDGWTRLLHGLVLSYL